MSFTTKLKIFEGHSEQLTGSTMHWKGVNKYYESSAEYNDNYHHLYTNRSLVDKEYVDNVSEGDITGATNGLSITGKTIVLGGGLVRDTYIDGDFDLKFGDNNKLNWFSASADTIRFSKLGAFTITDMTVNGMPNYGTGVEYTADYSATYSELSLVHKGYVDNKVSGTTNAIGSDTEIIFKDGGVLNGAEKLKYLKTDVQLIFGNSHSISSGTLNSAIIGGTNNVIGTGNNNAVIIGGSSISLADSSFSNYVAVPSLAIINEPITSLQSQLSDKNLLIWNSTSKKVEKILYSSFGGITGGTNGLTKVGASLKLGGNLIEDTNIDGSFNLNFGGTTSLNSFYVKAGGINLNPVGTMNITIGNDGDFIVTDNSGDNYGIRYAANYSTGFVDRSLVDKGYVDGLLMGVDAKEAVNVATTSNITISSAPAVVDGYTLIIGDRILVKNQTNKIENGIYDWNGIGSPLTRSSDFDGSSGLGIVTQGAYCYVMEGSTHKNQGWMLITPDPLSIGTSELDFVLFSSVTDINDGNGIDITNTSGLRVISVSLDSNSGLSFNSTKLRISNDIDGNGLSFTDGVLHTNTLSGGGNSIGTDAIRVKHNSTDLLVVNKTDIVDLLGTPIISANNGLTKSGSNVVLGGALTGNTSVSGGDSHNLSFSNINSYILSFQSSSITDLKTTKTGLVYAGDYSATFIDESLVTKRYVDSHLVSFGITGGTNGLTKSGNLLKLGGTLTESAVFTDNRTTKVGLQYKGDYSTTYTDRSLVDKGFVLGLINAVPGTIDANNGLYKPNASEIRLGGVLSEDTTISGVGSKSLYLGTAESALTNGNIYAQNVDVVGTSTLDLISSKIMMRASTLIISGTTNQIYGTVKLMSTLNTGSTTDKVLVWNDTDKKIYSVNQSTILSRYKVDIITTNTVLTGIEYVILVNTNSTEINITLPPSPANGTAFKIKDYTGNAFIKNVTISGNGKNIDDGTTALINTDYGSVEIVYSATADKWNTLAFIN